MNFSEQLDKIFEGAKEDLASIKIANDVFDKILENIDKTKVEFGTVKVAFESKQIWNEPVLKFDLGILYPEYKNLDIVFSGKPAEKANLGASYHNEFQNKPLERKYIKIPILTSYSIEDLEVSDTNEIQTPEKLQNLIKNGSNIIIKIFKNKTEKIKELFVHEFVHYLDNIRFKKQEAFNKGSSKDYYNSPEEFNAFYIELLRELERIEKNSFKKSFPEFLKIVINSDKINVSYQSDKSVNLGSWYERLNDEYKRKFTKRLHNFWLSKQNGTQR